MQTLGWSEKVRMAETNFKIDIRWLTPKNLLATSGHSISWLSCTPIWFR